MNFSVRYCFALALLGLHLVYLSAVAAIPAVNKSELIYDKNFLGAAFESQGFAASIARDQNRLAVAAQGDDTVLMYSFDGFEWQFDQAFVVEGLRQSNGGVITSLDFQNDRIVIGSFNSNNSFSDDGVVYIYESDGAGIWQNTGFLSASDANEGAIFGSAVYLHNDLLLVSARRDSVNTFYGGAVYFFQYENGTWVEKQKITADDTGSRDEFGSSIAFNGTHLIVGAHFNNYNGSQTGAAYAFDFDGQTFTQSEKLLGSPKAVGSRFGISVSLFGNTLAIGASRGYNGLGVQTGSVYFFEHGGLEWSQTDKITGGLDGSLFGNSVSLNNEKIAVGSGNAGTLGVGVFVFESIQGSWGFEQYIEEQLVSQVVLQDDMLLMSFPQKRLTFAEQGAMDSYHLINSNWEFSQRLEGFTDTVAHDRLGQSFSILGDEMLVASPGDELSKAHIGTVRIFEKQVQQWNQQDLLVAGDVVTDDAFGGEVILLTDKALISAVGDDDMSTDAGAIYYFSRQNDIWTESQKITVSNATNGDKFGGEMIASEDYLFVASNIDDDTEMSSVYVFEFDNNNWVERQVLSSGVIGDGFGASMKLDGGILYVAAPSSDVNPQGEIHTFELINGTWTSASEITLVDDPGLLELGKYFDVSGDRLVVAHDFSTKIFQGEFTTYQLFLYTLVNGNWQFQGVQQNVVENNAYKFSPVSRDVALNNDNLVISMYGEAHSNGTYQVFNYFYEFENDALSAPRVFRSNPAAGGTELSVHVNIDGDEAYIGMPWFSFNNTTRQQAGAIQSYRINLPDVIFLGGFDSN
ncbi:hypothetical protein [Marinicella sp. W31]|uniref:FG-GAP repeat protein n=1 Tax=Marinicella sp. W31 TaxID=3023713 RepID=UPI003757C047